MARPKKDIDPRQVEQLAAIGCSGAEIAAVLDCAESTLYDRFSESLKKGREIGKSSLRRAQWAAAVNKGNVAMLIWLGKQRLNQRDRLDLNSITPEQALAILREEAGDDSE